MSNRYVRVSTFETNEDDQVKPQNEEIDSMSQTEDDRETPNSIGETFPSTSMNEQELSDFPVTNAHDRNKSQAFPTLSAPSPWWFRHTYPGALLINLATAFLPALYATLSKLWVAQIDSSSVVTTDAYTYIGVIAEILNEGLPRAAYNVIGDNTNRLLNERLILSTTLVTFQMIAGFILSLVILLAAPAFAGFFVPIEVRDASITYVRICAFSTFFSTTEYAVSTATRSLDRPDVPLIFSLSKVIANIVLDMIFLSTFRSNTMHPTVNTQATIRLICDGLSAAAGLIFFLVTIFRYYHTDHFNHHPIFRFPALKILMKSGAFTFFESAVRNVLYLWLVAGVVAMGSNYATAWGVFNTIRWGVVMVPVSALEATSATFTGHAWGIWNSHANDFTNLDQRKKALRPVMKPALISTTIALVVEGIIAIVLSFWVIWPFAYFLSDSVVVADITTYMWKTIDWTYICYAVSTQLATILLATRTSWYLFNSVFVNIMWTLPWAIAVTKIGITQDTAWKYHSIIFGGGMVASLIVIIFTIMLWRRSVLGMKFTVCGARWYARHHR